MFNVIMTWNRRNGVFCLATLCLWMVAMKGWSQGTFNFSNLRQGDGARVKDCSGELLSGEVYRVQLLIKNPASGKWSPNIEVIRAREGAARLTTVSLLEGKAAGGFSAGTVRVPFLAGGKDAELLVRVWDSRTGKDYDSATTRGESRMTLRLAGGSEGIPEFPTPMNGFSGVKVCPIKGGKAK